MVKANRDITLLYPDVRVRYRRTASVMGEQYKPIFMTEGFRTSGRQGQLYLQGRSQPGPIVTHARVGDSLHEYGLALDIGFDDGTPFSEDDPWDDFGRIAKGFGFVWGGDWLGKRKDRPHLQLTYGLTLEECKALYASGGIISVWASIDKIRGVPIGSEWYGPQQKG